MTEKLYYQDAGLTEFTAVVQLAEIRSGQLFATLDKTAFYPEGGGQPADSGWLKLSDGTRLEVLDVQEAEGEIWHTLKPEKECALRDEAPAENGSGIGTEQLPKGESSLQAFCRALPGTEVTGSINWERRFDHMQQHSGEHIVSGMICSAFGCNNVGFHMGEDIVTIDYDARISFEQILEIEEKANRYLWENHAFEERWPSPEELKSMEYRSKKELEGDVRITSFPGADSCACCGTHVFSSAQVGLVKFLSAKAFREGTRLELLCGKRALDYLSMNYTENKAVAVKLSTSEQNTSDYVSKLIEEHLKEKTAASIAEEELLKKWAESFPEGDKGFVIEDWMSPKQGRQLADLVADSYQVIAVFAKNGDSYQYSVIARNADISAFIKEMNQALNGRGGGRNGFAQGSVKLRRKEIKEYLLSQGFASLSN